MASGTEAWNVTERDWPADGSAGDKLEYLLRWAILAPSTHSTQPWLFRLEGERLELLPDLRWSLAVVDPEDRELAEGSPVMAVLGTRRDAPAGTGIRR